MTHKLFKSWTSRHRTQSSLKSVDTSVCNRQTDPFVGREPVHILWGQKLHLDSWPRSALFEFLWQQLWHSALKKKKTHACLLFMESRGFHSKKFRYLPSDRIHGLAWSSGLCQAFRGNLSQILSFSLETYSFVSMKYFKFIIACMLHFIVSGRIVIRCRELWWSRLIILQRGGSAELSDWTKTHSNLADSSHKALLFFFLPACALRLLRHL